ncbi:MAG: 7-cyano-7-deazaguanine synthase QueC [Puniceicoccales bacterium]|jgi:7-cyano-7-deazaguanine synthase|nr:7-cyano-7-deazaguanine synthase QueC [Puniceicoccales bacterium]
MKTVVVLSGGLDSTVLLASLLAEGRECLALSFDYGQRHVREIDSARAVCAFYGVHHQVADLKMLTPLWGSNSLTDTSVQVPNGHYTEEQMKVTVVPGRNLVFLSIAAAWAMGNKCDSLAYGAHGGDHTIYPDCRPEFATALGNTLALADWHRVSLEHPFASLDKTAIVRIGKKLGAPFHLTWSCYKGGERHCGLCATCVERREAFANAGVPDPLGATP